MHIAFIINTNSSKARKANEAISPQLFCTHDAFFTTGPGSANEIATECLGKNYTHFAVLGGDGTLNEVFNAMMNSGGKADELPILIIHPCGTGNDFARNFHLKNTAEDFLLRLKKGAILYSDGGLTSYKNNHEQIEQRYFINVMDVGLGGLIAQRVNSYRRGRLSFLSYQRSILRTLPFYRKKNVTVKKSSILYSGSAMSIVIANGKWFGNGLGIAPDAEVNDGQLQCIVLARVSFWDYVLHLPSILRCKKINHPQVFYNQLKEVTIEGEGNPIELDGEYVGSTPARIRTIPRAVRLLVG